MRRTRRVALAVALTLVVGMAAPLAMGTAQARAEEAMEYVEDAGYGAPDGLGDQAPMEGDADDDVAMSEDGADVPSAAVPQTQGATSAATEYRVQVEAQDAPMEQEGRSESGLAPQATMSAEAEVEDEDEQPALPTVSGRGYLSRCGWRDAKVGASGGVIIGTTESDIALEAMRLRVSGGSVVLRVRSQRAGGSAGWGSRVRDGIVGTPGAGRRLEVVQIWVDGAKMSGYDIVYRVDVQGIGWMGWARNGGYAGTSGYDAPIEAVEVRVVRKGERVADGSGVAAYKDAGFTAQAHVQRLGWMKARTGNTVTVGTKGRALRLEGLRVTRPSLDVAGDVVINAYVQGVGWQGRRGSGRVIGTEGKGKRIEAVTVWLTGDLADGYDVWYRLHVEGIGWMGWARNGQRAGTVRLGRRVEAIQLALRRKGATTPAPIEQGIEAPYVDGAAAGITYGATTATKPLGRRSDGATLGSATGGALTSLSASSSIDGLSVWCSAHEVRSGWTDYVADGVQAGSGTEGVDAVRMRLSGNVSALYSVWYRAYIRGVGWTLWAADGEEAGTTGRGLSVVAVQAKIISRTAAAPSNEGARVSTALVNAAFPQLTAAANANQKRIVRSAKTTPWPGPGLCAGWVEDVYARAGRGIVRGNACDLYDRYCKSSNPSALKVGMIVAVRTHNRSLAGSIWGHVGVYVGDGWVMHSVGNGVQKVTLSWWTSYYGATCTPKWGWLASV